MKTATTKIISLSLLAAALSFSLSGCGSSVQSQELARNDAPEQVVPVESEQVEAGAVRAFYRSTAILEADQEARLVAEATGLVTEILVGEGDWVAKGAVLARLDTERAELEVSRNQANLNRLELAMKRQQELVKRGMASTETADQVQAEYEMTRAALALVDGSPSDEGFEAQFDEIRGDAYLAKGDLERAAQHYEQALNALETGTGNRGFLEIKLEASGGSLEEEGDAS